MISNLAGFLSPGHRGRSSVRQSLCSACCWRQLDNGSPLSSSAPINVRSGRWMRLFYSWRWKGSWLFGITFCELFWGNAERFLRPIMESSCRRHDGQLLISFTRKQIHKYEAMLSCRSTSFPSLDLKEVMVFCFVGPFVICPLWQQGVKFDDTFPNWAKRNAFSTCWDNNKFFVHIN